MLTEERIRTIFEICQLWGGIDRKMFHENLQEQNVTREEQKEYMETVSVYCSTCKLRFNILHCHYCDNCGKALPLPENLFVLDLKNSSMLDDEHGDRIHGRHACDGKNFCRYCGNPR